MAKVVVDKQSVVAAWWPKLHLTVVAAGAGALWWLLTGLIARLVVEPLACKSSATLTACGDVPSISGAITTVLVMTIALYGLVSIRQPRPLLLVIAASVVLWGLGLYTAGLQWYIVLLFAVLAYGATFHLFALTGRVRAFWLSCLVTALVVVAVRLLVAF